jgi:small-conductance mechanosensitive channel
MLKTIDITTYTTALSTPLGWLDLTLAIGSFLIAYLLARLIYIRVQRGRVDAEPIKATEHFSWRDSTSRLLFPTFTLVFLMLCRALFRGVSPNVFLNIALPLAIALFVIRLATYSLHLLFPKSPWQKFSDRTVSWTIWVIVALYLLGFLGEIIQELDELKLPIGSGLSVWALLKSIVVVGIVVSFTLWLSSIIERRLLAPALEDNTSFSGRLFLVRLVRSLLLLIAILLAMQGIGIDLTVFAVLGGAIGVGIGFGLQKITANYISGFVVLADKSVRIGDMVTVGTHYGQVREIGARYVVVRSLVGVDAMIPNENLLTQVVFNHSSSQREARATLIISVAYGSDLRLAQSLLVKAANEQPRVMQDTGNAPAALVTNFADSGIELTLAFWIRDPENGQGKLKSDINLRVWDLFVENNINVPFPQMEVKLLK